MMYERITVSMLNVFNKIIRPTQIMLRMRKEYSHQVVIGNTNIDV